MIVYNKTNAYLFENPDSDAAIFRFKTPANNWGNEIKQKLYMEVISMYMRGQFEATNNLNGCQK